jgi:hypothetical protein
MLWGLTIFLKTMDLDLSQRIVIRRAALCGVLWLIGGIALPLIVIIVMALVSSYLAITAIWILSTKDSSIELKKKHWKSQIFMVLIAGIIIAPLSIYNLYLLLTDQFVQDWTSQNLILSPHPIHYIMAIIVLLPVAIFGARQLMFENPWKGWFLITWMILLPIFAYAPINLQRRLPDGVWVALVTLAVYGMWRLPYVKLWKFSLVFVISFLIFPSTLFLFAGGISTAIHRELPVFRPASEIAAFSYLSNYGKSNSVILSSYTTGNAAPAWGPFFVLIGHGPETINLPELSSKVSDFFNQDKCKFDCIKFLGDHDVDYVIWGPEERKLGNGNPGRMQNSILVFTQGDYQVFRIFQSQ